MSNYMDIPKWVKTPLTNVILSTDEMIHCVDKQVFLLFDEFADYISEEEEIDMVGCYNLKDVPFYADFFTIFANAKEAWGNYLFIKGVVMDPTDLPYELNNIGSKIFVFYNDEYLKYYYSMEEATKIIERKLDINQGDIKDIGIIIGEDISQCTYEICSFIDGNLNKYYDPNTSKLYN